MKPSQSLKVRFAVAPGLIILIILLAPSLSSSSHFLPIRTPSTGYQLQFEVSGNKIHYVWHEYDGPFRQIFTGEMNKDGDEP